MRGLSKIVFTEDIADAATYFALLQLEKHGDIKNPMSLIGPMMQIPNI